MKGAGICGQCGYYGYQKLKTKGSILIELVLWLMLLLPGLIYSIWRLTSRVNVCPNCDAENSFVPVNSPMGAKFIEEYNIDVSKKPRKPSSFRIA